jgi:hypothetical protein
LAQKDYLRLAALIDGQFQAEATSISINGQSGAQAVETIANGLSGKTPGSPRIEFALTSAVPTGGMEFDFVEATRAGTYHEVQLVYGTKTIVSKGWFQDFSLSQSTNASTETSGNFVGTYELPK